MARNRTSPISCIVQALEPADCHRISPTQLKTMAPHVQGKRDRKKVSYHNAGGGEMDGSEYEASSSAEETEEEGDEMEPVRNNPDHDVKVMGEVTSFMGLMMRRLSHHQLCSELLLSCCHRSS